jgi:hypothetical protein
MRISYRYVVLLFTNDSDEHFLVNNSIENVVINKGKLHPPQTTTSFVFIPLNFDLLQPAFTNYYFVPSCTLSQIRPLNMDRKHVTCGASCAESKFRGVNANEAVVWESKCNFTI